MTAGYTHLTLRGRPITKKNSSRIAYTRTGRPFIRPSAAYERYERACLRQIDWRQEPIDSRVRLMCVYYMPTKHRVDLCNLIEATQDILVRGGVLADDDSRIVVSLDGSCVAYDKKDPRVEILITGA